MKLKVKFIICILLCQLTVLLCSCTISSEFLRKKEQGLYPDTGDFPNTKWVCRELDMYFYMFDYGEYYMTGTYTVNNESYRVVARFDLSSLEFYIYSSKQTPLSEHSVSPFIHYDRMACESIYTDYYYNGESIVCTLYGSHSIDGENFPDTLTFDRTELIAQNTSTRWYAQELDMYLDSFSDVEDYFRGEITIRGEKCYVHAFEVNNNNYFRFSIENGKVNNYRPGTTSTLVYMYFEMHDNQIIARISDRLIKDPRYHTDWEYTGSTITFYPVAN